MRWIRHPGRALDAYLDEELPSSTAARVEAHLSRCSLCRQRLVVTARIRWALRGVFESALRLQGHEGVDQDTSGSAVTPRDPGGRGR